MNRLRLKVLIVGGYGTFGGRLVQLLGDTRQLTILVAGRSLHKASAFVDKSRAAAELIPTEFDRNGDVAAQIGCLAPDIVVDASGPFQFYGCKPYRLVEACIANRVNYIDLADSSAFVHGIAANDTSAQDANLFVLSGVSSCPVLTSAVCKYLSQDMTRVNSVRGGIAPSPYSSVGPSVIEAIAGYAGKPVAVVRNEKVARAYPFTETIKYTIASPGRLPLLPMTFSLVDVPDLLLLAEQNPRPANVWFGAAPVPAIYHALFRVLSRGVRLGIIRSLRALSSSMFFVMNHATWGEHRGGMFVEVSGIGNDGRDADLSWHLLAEGNDGPMIPSMAAAIIVNKCVVGNPPSRGARPAHGELCLGEFEPMFDRFNIRTGIRRAPPGDDWPLFRAILSDAWADVPTRIQRIHQSREPASFSGRATVSRGRSIFARIAAWLFGFPLQGANVPVTVEIHPSGSGEKWLRDFDGHSFSSSLTAGCGRFSNLLCERFGPFRFGMGLEIRNDELHYTPRNWTFFGIPMPKSLAPTGAMYEFVKDDVFHFHVEIALPIIGKIVTYAGFLETGDQLSSTS